MPEAIDPRTTPADPAFGAFLDALDEALDLPAGERAEVREEIGAHLRQARAEAIAAGTDEEAAVADVLRGFGDPRSVGRDLSRARQRRSALLAAAGAGTLAAAGAAFRGYILGIALIATVLSAIGVLLAISFRAGLTGTWSLSDQGWYTAVLGLALWFAAWHGGRSLVTVLASGRTGAPSTSDRSSPSLPGWGSPGCRWPGSTRPRTWSAWSSSPPCRSSSPSPP